MRVLIVGAGIVGSSLAEELSQEGHDVSVLDRRSSVLQEIQEHLDVLAVCGDATLPSDLIAAKIKEADMVIAVTNDDTLNILVCQIASKFNIARKIARIRNRELLGENSPLRASELGIDKVINPETVAIEMIKKTMEVPGSTEVADFAEGGILLAGFRIYNSTPVTGMELSQIKSHTPAAPFLIVAIVRNGQVIIPKGQEILKAKDNIFVIMDRDYVPDFLKLIGRPHAEKITKVIILSASPLARHLACELESYIERVVLIEKDRKIATEASKKLSTPVVHGDVTDPEVIRTVGMENATYFIAFSDEEESNILCSLVAKKYGAQQTIALQTTERYESLLDHLDIDVVVNPKHLTAGEILKHVRKGRIHSVTKLQKTEAEVIELEAVANAPIVGVPLKNSNIPHGALIATIFRDGKVTIPTGDSFVYPGERVVVIALPTAIEKIERLFGPR